MVWLVCGTVILAAALAGNLLGAHGLPPEHRPQLSRLLILLANLFCLYAAVGGLAWLVSSSSDRRGRAITILFLMLLSLFLLNYLVWCLRNNYTFFGDTTLAQFWHPLEKIAFLSPLHYHRPFNVLGTGAWPWRDMGVLLASGGAMWLTGGTVFARRDIYVLFDFLWSRWDSLPTPLWIPSTLRKGQGERWSRRDERESAQYQRGFPPQPNPLPRLRGRGRKPRPPLDTSGHSVFHPADRLTMPARTSQITRVGKRKVELSNLTKLLFPDDQIVKAQLIEYYLKIAPTILSHVKGRPLSLVRYPDGIGGESFFQKNRPDWAPDWIEHVTLGEEKKDYVIATEDASLVWLANLACIELHQMHSRAPHFDKPDYIVYDLDPPEDFTFAQVAEIALEFKEHLESFGYYPFVKTTGRKGLHVLAPIEPKWEFQKAFEAAKAVAQPFVDSHPSSLTLQIKKEHRKGRVLLDIYRNRQSQTIVAAYSVRGLPGAPVSTPLQWDELSSLESPKAFDLRNVPQRVIQNGDPWEAIAAYATPIHSEPKETKSSASVRRRAPEPKRPLTPSLFPSGGEGVRRAGEGSARTYKTPEQLENYSRKRSFDKTPEPPPAGSIGKGSAFVVHRHHASRLHYDLRLEQNGVLKSWAVPKGLPPRPGIMRLAVNVEDHPLGYVNFEGAIPKGEYGGGMMWKFAQGRYQITKQKKEGFYFRLQSRELNAEYRAHHTKENQWLLERVDNPQTDWLRDPIEPMLARPADKPPASEDYLCEVKWDGIRALISLDEGEIRIHGRNRMDLTKQFPELRIPAFRATSGLFDGEIVCLEADGKPNFRDVIQRMQQKTEGGIERAKVKHPAVCYVFDCLYLDGRPIVNEPLTRRREWLQDAIRKGSTYRVSEVVEDGAAFFDAVKQMGLEGIMAKQRGSAYLPGKRSDSWLKIKIRKTIECAIIGYTRGQGDRVSSFGALHLAQATDNELTYVGKVGSGFDEDSLKAVSAELEKLTVIKRPIKEKPLDDARSVWIEPKLICEVQFASLTKDGILREPVFLRLRPDLNLRG